MLYAYLKIGNKDTNICLIERKLVFCSEEKRPGCKRVTPYYRGKIPCQKVAF